MNNNLSKILIDFSKYTKLRREFHKIPEIGFEEYKTRDLIIDTLNKYDGFDKYSKLHKVGETGMFIDINGLKQSTEKPMTISFRADIDALPLKEETGVEYKSQHEGFAHSCGHDGHITILLATIEYYLSKLEQIPNTFTARFLFQPAEEAKGGANVMIDGGCLDNVDEIYGLHNLTKFKVGEIGVIEGTIMASINLFEINIKGKGGHSSTPNNCISPITIGAQLINLLNQVTSQEVDSNNRCVLAIGCFHSGQTFNVIPECGTLKGTFRTLSADVRSFITKRVQEICDNVARLYNAEIAVVFNDKVGIETVNTKEQTDLVARIADKHFKRVTNDLPIMGSEDFSYFLQKVPGCFFMLGGGDENHKEYVHHPKYNFNDDSIEIGVEMFIRIIEEKARISLIDNIKYQN